MAAEGSALRSLLAYFKIEVDDKQLKNANNEIDRFTSRLKTLARTAAITFVLVGIKDFIENQIDAAKTLTITADKIGITTRELQALQLVAQETGVPVDALGNGFRFLNRHLDEVSQGKGKASAAIFQRLGINVRDASGHIKPAAAVMEELADKISTIPLTAEKTNVAMTLLGRGGAQLVPLLEKGSKAFRDARIDVEALGGGLSEDFVAAANEARVAGVKLDFALTGLKSTVVGALLPSIKDTAEWFVKVVVNTIKFAKETTWLASSLWLLKAAAASAVVYLVAINLPLAAAAAAATVLYIAFDDLYAFLNGNESLIGDTLDHFFGLGTAAQEAKNLNEAFRETVNLVKAIGGEIKDDIILPFEYFNAQIHGDKAGAAKLADEAAARSQERLDSINLPKDAYERKYQKGKYSGNSEQAQYLRGEFEGPPRAPEEEEKESHKGTPGRYDVYGTFHPTQYEPRHAPPPAVHGGSSKPVTVHQHNQYDIKVDAAGAQDPNAVGKATGQGVSTAQQRANSQAFAVTSKP